MQARFYEPGGLAASQSQLYIADTNNHAIRIADLTTHLVKTLDIVLPSAEPVNQPPVFASRLERLPEQHVHLGEASIYLHLKLPEGHQLTSGQASQLTWTMMDAVTGQLQNQGSINFTNLEPNFTLTVPAGRSKVAINLTIYYCDETEGLCLMARCTLELSLYADPITQEHTITISLVIS